MNEPKIDVEFFPIFEGATELVARQLALFRDDTAEPTENEKLMAGHIVGNLCANGYTQLPGAVERLRAALDKIAHMEPSEIAPETFPGLVHGSALLFANSQRIAREALRPLNQQLQTEK